MEHKRYLAQSALQKELLKIFDAPRFKQFVNDLSLFLTTEVISNVKKTNPAPADFTGAARNVLCIYLSKFIYNE